MSLVKARRRLLISFLFAAAIFAGSLAYGLINPAAALASEDDDDRTPIRVGYVIVTPTSQNKTGLVVFETFGERRGSETSQAGVLPSGMTNSAMMMVSTSGRLSRNLGVAIANPGSAPANVQLRVHLEDGSYASQTSVTVPPKNQTARFVTELFGSQSQVPSDMNGTLQISTSPNTPVSVVGLRFRGLNFSTLPITNLSGFIGVPVMGTNIGGDNAVILPHFAVGGGWRSEIVISNSGANELTFRVDIFGQDGLPLVANLNGVSNSSFIDLKVKPWGVVILSQRDRNGDSDF